MAVDDNKPLDDDDVALKLSDLLSSVPESVTDSDLVSEDERLKDIEEQTTREEKERERIKEERRKRGFDQEKMAKSVAEDESDFDVPGSAENEAEQAKALLKRAVSRPAAEVKLVMPDNAANEVYGYSGGIVGAGAISAQKSDAKELPPLPSYVQKEQADVRDAINGKMPLDIIYKTIKLLPVPGLKAKVDSVQALHKERWNYFQDRFGKTFREKKVHAGVLCLMTIGLLIASMIHSMFTLFEIQHNRAEILQKFSQTIGREVVVLGKVDFIPLPPHFVFEDVTIKNNEGAAEGNFITVDEVKVVPSFFPLVLGQLSLSEVELIGPTVYVENYSNLEPNWVLEFAKNNGNEEQLTEFINTYVEVDEIVFKAGKLVLRSGDATKPEEQTIHIPHSVITAGSIAGPYNISGDLEFREIKNTFSYEFSLGELEQGNEVDFNFELEGDGLTASYTGVASKKMATNFFDGKFVLLVEKAQAGLKDYFGPLGSFANRLAGAVLEAKDGKANAKITFDNNHLKINELTATSEFVDVELNIGVLFGDVAAVDVAVDVGMINMDAGAQAVNDPFKLLTLDGIARDFSDKRKYSIDLKAKSVMYGNNEYTNIIFKSGIHGSNVNIKELNIEGIPGGSRLWLSGEVAEKAEGEVDVFLGSFNIFGDSAKEIFEWFEVKNELINVDTLGEYSFVSQLKMEGADTHFINYKLTDGKTLITGDMNVTQPDVKPEIKMSVYVEKIDFNHYLNIKRSAWVPVDERDLNEQYALFDWLRRVRRLVSVVDADIRIEEAQFRNQKLQYLTTNFLYDDSKVSLSDSSFLTEMGKTRFDIALDNANLVPNIDIDIKSDTIDTKVMKNILGIKDTDVDEERIDSKAYWSSHLFDLTLFNVFTGKFDVEADTLRHRQYVLNDFKMTSLNKNKYIDIKSVRADLDGGSLKLSGKIETSTRPVLSYSASLRNSDLRNFFNITLGERAGDKVSGRFSASMTGKLDGYSMSEWVGNLSGRLQIIARGITFKGANLGLLTKKIPEARNSQEARYWIRKSLSGGYVGLEYVAGTINFSGGVGHIRNVPIQDKLLINAKINGLINIAKWQVDLNTAFQLQSSRGLINVTNSLVGSLSGPVQSWPEKELFKKWQSIFFSERRR
jgi:uncharacterized protein involved in outer membrane biogenesis